AAQRHALLLAPDRPPALRRLAHLLGRAGHIDQAVKVAHSIMAIDPQNVAARIALSDLLLRHGRNAEAMAEALMAAVIDPDSAATYSNLGHVFHRTSHPAAETVLLRAARLD